MPNNDSSLSHRLFYMFLLRVPVFFLIHTLANLYTYFIHNNLEYLFLLYFMIFPFAAMFFLKQTMRSKTVGITIILFLAALFTALALLQPSPVLRRALCIMIFASVLSTFFYRAREFDRATFAVWTGANVAFFAASAFSEATVLKPVFLAQVFIVVIISQICKYIQNTDDFIRSPECSDSPRKTIVSLIARSNKMFFILLIVVSILGGAAALFKYPTINKEKPFRDAWDYIDTEPEGMKNAFEESTGDIPAVGPEEEEYIYNETEEYVQPVSYRIIIFALLISAVIVFIIIMMRRTYGISSLFNDYDETTERAGFFADGQKRGRRAFASGTNQTIRRIFYKKVREHKRRWLTVKKSNTAQSLTDKIRERENIDKLSALYHKARYSGETVTKSEIEGL